MIYVLIRKGSFIFLDIDCEWSERYDSWYFNKKNILFNIGWKLDMNSTFDSEYADYEYCASKYDHASMQVIRCIQGFGVRDLLEMEKETLKYIFDLNADDEFI